MIYTDSRYADGTLVRALDARKNVYSLAVLRNTQPSSSEFYYYTWTVRDRMDLVAHRFLGNVDLWWKIMDFNPEIGNAFDITPGTVLRIPSGK
jgi:hypothetical protein